MYSSRPSPPALLQSFLDLLPVLSHPIEPGAALQIGAGAAQLIALLPCTDPDGAVGRAATAATDTAGVGGHPVQSAVYSRPVYGLPAGYEGRPHGDLTVGDVLAGAGPRSPPPRRCPGGRSRRGCHGGMGLGWGRGFGHELKY